ncbi:ABC transporter ATP-binding protein [Thiomonas sp. FB-6]|uniref:ABC transporter ATP-binding protein n=1 Tax=Thiomonas sp. FB-6 TaxID=1158291 RepID=UPI000399D3C3|nr:ABC transporter ATP-binding protein [Thiomonas sp. FB-6]
MSPALEVRGLCKAFGGLQVTRGVDLHVAQGERHLLIGPNGAGKTTLFNLIAGDLRGDAGSIVVHGQDLTRMPAAARAQRGVARTYQIITLFPHDTLLHNVKLALLGRSRKRWLPWGDFAREAALQARALEALTAVGLADKAELPLRQTSYGDKRRLEIAMALAQRPRLLLLDEPLAGLSAQEREGIGTMLAGIGRAVTIVLIEHDMRAALALADRVTLLNQGQIVLSGDRDEVVQDPRTRQIYLGH